jgi:hypothetical protein
MSAAKGIWNATARRRDQKAMGKLLSILDDAGKAAVRGALAENTGAFTMRHYDRDRRRLHLVATNADSVDLWTWDDVRSLQEAAEICAAIDAHGRIDSTIGVSAYTEATGRKMGLVS